MLGVPISTGEENVNMMFGRLTSVGKLLATVSISAFIFPAVHGLLFEHGPQLLYRNATILTTLYKSDF